MSSKRGALNDGSHEQGEWNNGSNEQDEWNNGSHDGTSETNGSDRHGNKLFTHDLICNTAPIVMITIYIK